ncbi:MAG: hemerythrin domain-containing protein [Clostridium sp.]|uniref:hemerythrin domain-containing protein n=1 Tax=Clostridium sp. TaxID=1506 RepID=UPI0025BD02CF|nr:hemerythrin domain-containing protein [Clostridium sp.]MCH3963329.1 hemerythrin domain-containing protein [Clostridium sp.]MCI1716803.1 hemerythrin domain-containing protein [Clostridium sp.]MCI1801013.1 hemerythrin domain-containing protein [Clostridium sp.]MCI1814989.1 hemerythrin domain-containing protein [Clostridium sp.]MCI1871890.1 hemerythrin domain-containing protein [Clostridium sp.]
MDVKNLERQHNEIMNLTDYVLQNVKNHTVDENSIEIARSINTLSGKLRIHLFNEDKYLYPHLSSSPNKLLNMFGKKYSEEMKEVTGIYNSYKSKYNTPNKIKNSIDEFYEDTKKIFKVLSNRIFREEKELYPLLDE